MAGLRRRVTRKGDRVAPQFVEQAKRGGREQAGQQKEHIAPAEIIAEHAAGGLAEQLAEDLARQEAADHQLAALVRDDIADKGQREWKDPAGG